MEATSSVMYIWLQTISMGIEELCKRGKTGKRMGWQGQFEL